MWCLERALNKAKWACDVELDDGNYEQALRFYTAVYKELEVCNNLNAYFFRSLQDFDVAYCVHVYDLLISITWLQLRLDKMEDFRLTMDLFASEPFFDKRVQRGLSFNTFMLGVHLMKIYQLLYGSASLHAGYTAQMWLDTVRLSHFPRFGDNWIEDSAKMAPYFSHDLKVFVKNAKMDEPPSPSCIPLDQYAARQMRPRRVFSDGNGDPPIDGNVPKARRTMLGWQDSEALAKLTKEEQQKINKLQREKGFEVTDFSQGSAWKTLADKYADIGLNIKWTVPPKLTGEGQ